MFRLEGAEDTKTSRFLMTVNPNRAYREKGEALRAKKELERTLRRLFSSFEDYVRVYQREGKTMQRVEVPLQRITEEAKIQSSSEIGTLQHRLHNHSLITIVHRPQYNLRLNLPKLRQHLPPGVHLDVKFIRDPDFTLQAYVYKNKKSRESKG